MNYICYQLWGNNPMYIKGMLENIKQVPKYYPGFKVILYKAHDLDFDVPGVITISMPDEGMYNFFWRLHAFDDFYFDRMLFRDADSRLNSKEQAAVMKWMRGDQLAYIMHDHKEHGDPIMAGMWGVRGRVITGIRREIKSWMGELGGRKLEYGSDQWFLHARILPKIRHSLIRFGKRHPFPSDKIDVGDFVGQKILCQ